jgi:small subunit ribosomal protein S20
MPRTKSAKKALKVARKRTIHHKRLKERIKGLIKSFKRGQANISEVSRALDKAAKKRVIHKNKAARLKSRLMRLFQKQSKKKGE